MSTDCTSNYPNTISDIAQEIISDLNTDTSLSIAYLSTWIRDNIGKLNNAIGSSICIGENLEFVPCITNDQKDILKWFFTCKYYANLARANLGAAAYDWVEMREGDTVIRTVSKNEIAKTYAQLASQCETSLKEIIKFYRMNHALPKSMSAWDSPMWLYPRVND